MRRLNVQYSQIEECIRKSLFAVDNLPRNPPLKQGELLLLQLVKEDAKRRGKVGSRIEFALVYDHHKLDGSGAISREHWPNAGKTWRYILICAGTIPTVPFNLESLQLTRDYGGQTQALFIDPVDEARIELLIQPQMDALSPAILPNRAVLLQTIRNYDRVLLLSPAKTTDVRAHTRVVRDSWLGDALKNFYGHQCQVCANDFRPRYGVPYADTRLIASRPEVPKPVSTDLVVVCPNHNAIIASAHAEFELSTLEFRYPNGLREKLILRDHLLS
jgi:hypothetical protein